MQSLKNKKRPAFIKLLVVALMVATLLAGSAAAVLFMTKTGPFSLVQKADSKSTDDSSTSKSDSDLGIKPATSEDPTSNSVKVNPQSPETSDKPSLEITSAQVNGDKLVVRTLLSKVTNEGSCSLSAKTENSGTVYTTSAGVQAVASSSTCKGFDIPVSTLGSGTWKIIITYTSGSVVVTAEKDVIVDA